MQIQAKLCMQWMLKREPGDEAQLPLWVTILSVVSKLPVTVLSVVSKLKRVRVFLDLYAAGMR